MARCAREQCGRWRPDFLRIGASRRGVSFEEVWYCSRSCFEALTRERLIDATTTSWSQVGLRARTMRLGAILLHQKSITGDTLKAALAEQETSGLRRCATSLVDSRTASTPSSSGNDLRH